MTAALLESMHSALIERRYYKWPSRFFHTFGGFRQIRRQSRFFFDLDVTLSLGQS
jgi:hypothetical protein